MGKRIKSPETYKRHEQSKRNKSSYYHKIFKSFAQSEFSISSSTIILRVSKTRYKDNGDENKIKMTMTTISIQCHARSPRKHKRARKRTKTYNE